MRPIVFLISALIFFSAQSQITEDFSDGNFTSNPTWSGDDIEFQVSSGELQLFDDKTDDSHLMTASTIINDGTWEFLFRWEGFSSTGLSSSNEVFFYLVADQNVAPESNNIEGYVVRIGNTSDEVSFYRQDTDLSSLTELIDGNANGFGGVTASSSGSIRVRVSRDDVGNWTLEADILGGTSFSEVGTVMDATYTTGAFTGLFIDYSSGNADGYFFDDIQVSSSAGPDTDPPTIQSATAISATQVDVQFNENVDITTAQNTNNYSLDGGVTISSAVRDAVDNSLVHLTTSALTNGSSYTVTIGNVEDENGNAIIADSQESFQYLVFAEAVALDVVINEFMPDPNPVVTTLPDAEYVELYNRSNKYFNLENWTLDGETLPAFTLAPDSYVIVVESSDAGLFGAFSDVLSISNLALNNSSTDNISLLDDNAATIHAISFTGSSGGTSTELINPNGPDYSANNYGLSVDSDGGTPGEVNSIFDDTPDTTPPTIASIAVISNTQLDVSFDEVLEESSAETTGNYSIDGGISIVSAMRDDTDNQLVHLVVDPLVSGQVRTLTVNGVTDLSINAISGGTIQFEYIETEVAVSGDVIINEFLSNPVDDNDDFIELLNVSNKFIDLSGWNISDKSSTSEDLPSFILRPGAYLIIYDEDALTNYATFGDALTIASLTLNNSDDQIEIVNGTDTQIDFLAYEEAQSDGVSLELINPDDPCRSLKNYIASVDPSGSTPGRENSVFDSVVDNIPPEILAVAVLSSTALDVSFNEALDETSAELIGNYSIDGGIAVVSANLDGADDQLVHLVVDPLVSQEVRTLTINGVSDLCGNPMVNETAQFEYIETEEAILGDVVINEFLSNPVNNSDDFVELYNNSNKIIDIVGWNLSDETSTSEDFPSAIIRPGEYLIIYDEDATIDYSSFGNSVTIANLTLNNSEDQIEVVNGADVRIAFLAYEEAQEDGVSLELINPNDPCVSLSSYSASTDVSGSTPGRRNSVFDDTPDTTGPTVQSYNFDGSLTINFSEVMDAANLSSGTYTVSNNVTINAVTVVGELPTSIQISFNETIQQGVLYTLMLSGVTDCSGNAIEETTITFGIGRSPVFNELIITELMFDPDPQVELPNEEFVEIYNATSDLLSTEGMSYTDASTTVSIPARTLNPGEYYVLAKPTAATEFAGNSIGVSNFPSLNNSGEQLLLSLADELIFSLTYDPAWHDEDKAGGGYTLEMVDITNPCLEDANNWRSSQASAGGTPAASNSVSEVIPDNFGPEIVSATAELADSIRVEFNEKLDPSSVLSAVASLNPSIGIDQVFFDKNNPSTVIVTLVADLEQSTAYTLSMENITDCSGNEIQGGEVTFALPVQAGENEIKLSEVLFNPRSNGVDFVEIYNDSDKYISLKNWKLGNLDDAGEVDDVDVITTSELVIAPSAFLVFTTDVNILLTNYPKGQSSNFFEVSSMPSYNDADGNVLLIDADGETVETFSYDADFHYNLLRSVDGVSLERVSYEESTANSDNWRSASSTEGFATPGYANSQSFENDAPIGRVTANPEVFIPGNTGSGRDFTTINYQFDQPGQFANVNIYDQTGRLVKNLAQGVLLSTSGFLRWDGDTNDGQTARMGYHLIIFEIYDSSGNSEVIKETVVVGRDF